MSATERYRQEVARCAVNHKKGFVDLSGLLNHQLDPVSLLGVCEETHKQLGAKADIVLTAPTSGNALAALYGAASGLKVVLCKSAVPRSWHGQVDVVGENLPSVTMEGVTRMLSVKRDSLRGQRVIIVDDVMGKGDAFIAMIRICKAAGAVPVACVAFVEKAGKGGRQAVGGEFPTVPVVAVATVPFKTSSL